MDSDSRLKTVAAREAAQAAVGCRGVVEEEMPGQHSDYNQRRPPPCPPPRAAVSGRNLYPRRSAGGNTNKHHRHLPPGVLFSSEETVLFHPVQGANSALLCVCVSVYLVCTVPLTERTLNKCHPMPRTDTPVQRPQIPAAAHVSARLSRLIRSP